MKKIRNSRIVEEQKEKRNKIILGAIISFIMVGSILSVFVYKDENTDIRTYKAADGKKYKFAVSRSNIGLYGYETEIGDDKLFFYNYPQNIINATNASEEVLMILNNPVAYFAFDPQDSDLGYIDQARFDLSMEFSKNNRYLIPSKIKDSTTYELYPIIDCYNATMNAPVLKFVNSNKTRIVNEDYCVTFEGKKEDFLMYRDLILYKLYGLI